MLLLENYASLLIFDNTLLHILRLQTHVQDRLSSSNTYYFIYDLISYATLFFNRMQSISI